MPRRLSTCVAAFWLLSCLVAGVRASDDAYPRSLSGFIKPGMHLGVSYQNSPVIVVEILTNDQLQIWKDAREKNSQDLGPKQPKAPKPTEKEAHSFLARTMYICTVVHVGDDYILVALPGSRKQAIAIRFISKIICEAADDSTIR